MQQSVCADVLAPPKQGLTGLTGLTTLRCAPSPQALRSMAERYASFAGSESERLTPLVETLSERWAHRVVLLPACCARAAQWPHVALARSAGSSWSHISGLACALLPQPWPLLRLKLLLSWALHTPRMPRTTSPLTTPPPHRLHPAPQVPGREVQRREVTAGRGARCPDPRAGLPPLPAVHGLHVPAPARGPPPQARGPHAAGPLPQGGCGGAVGKSCDGVLWRL